MTDKYYYTNFDKEQVTQALGLTDIDGNALDEVTEGIGGTYYQNKDYVFLWVGKIPKTRDENGVPLTYEADGANLFNVRFINEEAMSDFSSYTEIAPVTPVSVFA